MDTFELLILLAFRNMQFKITAIAACLLALTVSASPLPQDDVSTLLGLRLLCRVPFTLTATCFPSTVRQYHGVSKTPELTGLNAVLAEVQGGLEKLTQGLSGKARRGEINLQDTPLSSIPELIPLLSTLGLPAGNH